MDYWTKKRILDYGENPALMGSRGGKASARSRARKKAAQEAKEREDTRVQSMWWNND